jgi:hypothetical protein
MMLESSECSLDSRQAGRHDGLPPKDYNRLHVFLMSTYSQWREVVISMFLSVLNEQI